jgi:hypothetical protein
MKVAYFDCFSGAAGDMILAALLDVGANFDHLLAAIGRLGLSGYRLSAEKIKKQGIAATSFSVSLADASQPHRHLWHVVEILNAAEITPKVRERAIGSSPGLPRPKPRYMALRLRKFIFMKSARWTRSSTWSARASRSKC